MQLLHAVVLPAQVLWWTVLPEKRVPPLATKAEHKVFHPLLCPIFWDHSDLSWRFVGNGLQLIWCQVAIGLELRNPFQVFRLWVLVECLGLFVVDVHQACQQSTYGLRVHLQAPGALIHQNPIRDLKDLKRNHFLPGAFLLDLIQAKAVLEPVWHLIHFWSLVWKQVLEEIPFESLARSFPLALGATPAKVARNLALQHLLESSKAAGYKRWKSYIYIYRYMYNLLCFTVRKKVLAICDGAIQSVFEKQMYQE